MSLTVAAQLRSGLYTELLNKPPLSSMAWHTFKVLQHPLQSGSKWIFSGGSQKGETYPCTSRGIKVTKFQNCLCIIIAFCLPKNLNLGHQQIWHPSTLMPLEIHGHLLLFENLLSILTWSQIVKVVVAHKISERPCSKVVLPKKLLYVSDLNWAALYT